METQNNTFIPFHCQNPKRPTLSSVELCLWIIVTLMLKHVFFIIFFILSVAAAICIWKSLWCLYLKHAALWSLWLVQYEYTTLSGCDLKRRNEAKLFFWSELNLKGPCPVLILFSQVWINLTLRRLTNQLMLLSSGLHLMSFCHV